MFLFQAETRQISSPTPCPKHQDGGATARGEQWRGTDQLLRRSSPSSTSGKRFRTPGYHLLRQERQSNQVPEQLCPPTAGSKTPAGDTNHIREEKFALRAAEGGG